MKIIKKTFYLLLVPLVITAAIVLFILDNLNVDVNPIMSYTQKESNQS